MPPSAYEERFTAENDGIISQLGIDTVVDQAQEVVAATGIIETVTPTPEPENEDNDETDDDESDEGTIEENIFTQWNIFEGEKEMFTQKQIENFSANLLSIFDKKHWKGPLIQGSKVEHVTFSFHYSFMTQWVVAPLSFGLLIYFYNMMKREQAGVTPLAPYGSYVTYPTFPYFSEPNIKETNMTYSSETPSTGKSFDVFLKENNESDATLNNMLLHQKNKDLSNRVNNSDESKRDTWAPLVGFFNLFANVGNPILQKDIGTPQYMELMRRGQPMILDSQLRMTLVISTILALIVWWLCADWIETNLAAILREEPEPGEDKRRWDKKTYKILTSLKAGRGELTFSLWYASSVLLLILLLTWGVLFVMWYTKLWGSWLTKDVLVTKTANNDSISAHNLTRLRKLLEDKVVRAYKSDSTQKGRIHDILGLQITDPKFTHESFAKVLALIIMSGKDLDKEIESTRPNEDDNPNVYLKQTAKEISSQLINKIINMSKLPEDYKLQRKKDLNEILDTHIDSRLSHFIGSGLTPQDLTDDLSQLVENKFPIQQVPLPDEEE